MLLKKIELLKQKIKDNLHLYSCPICSSAFKLENNSLVCEKRHTYDLSKKGYVNFFGHPSKITELYDKNLFTCRKLVSDSGFYNPLCDALAKLCEKYAKGGVVFDAGCGGGNIPAYIANLVESNHFLCADLSSAGIEFAAQNYFYGDNITLFIANLNNIPLQDNSTDIILNVMSPACYEEFYRILKNDGVIIRVLLEADYLKNLRHFMYVDSDNGKYSNSEVFSNMEQKLQVVETVDLNYTHNFDKEYLSSLFDMTPLTKNTTINGRTRDEIREDFIASYDNFTEVGAFKIVVIK